ncbi:exonuclease subunit SbcD [Vibrio hippocampi]|uniref:Nuclease SbcCD subunit D n=1 Tax=Vibrio hippocampi TaxID=654686 RepID=A0ABN8DIH4_9VIBR|nr:exonuclease subunit SbcD [Vibrio hippocampi]CAH0525673.1 Nuclease SbcCD subunit D [Vibrio hippocampi]
MKILHTSDWHLGQNFYNKSRKAEHEQFLNWLLQQVTQHSVDAIIVAGDIFDTSTPPSYAREMYHRFVVEANKVNCQLLMLGGNHDSVSVLNESKQIVNYLNTAVVPNTAGDIEQQVVEVKGKSGAVEALVCAIPFIRPRDVLASQAGVTGSERQQQLGEAIKQHYQLVYQAAVEHRQSLPQAQQSIPIIATGHLTALGVSQSESVRDIYIGTLDGFAAEGFPPADYIALGHIHRPQIVAKSEHIRYSGSPIALSFDELKSDKQVMLVEFDQGNRHITGLPVPRFQLMAEIKGDLASIESQLANYAESEQRVWLSIEVSLQDYLSDLQDKVRELTQGLNVEVLQLKRSREQRMATLAGQNNEMLSELKPLDVFEKRIELEAFDSDEEQQRLQRMRLKFKQILSEVETNPHSEQNDGESA